MCKGATDRMDNQKIILHLGVHKTATTHIQQRLYNSIDILNKYNIGYIGLNEIRKIITSKLGSNNLPKKEILHSLKAHGEYQTLIISDENILGGTDKPLNNMFYPDVIERLKQVLSLFEGKELVVYITLRNYVDYYISRYAESLRHFGYLDFDKYYEDLDFASVGWIDLIEQIQKAGIDNINITLFEDIFKNEQKYFDFLVGVPGIKYRDTDNNPHIRRSKFSNEGYRLIKFYANNYSKQSIRKILNLIDNNPQTEKFTPFMPFSNFEQKILNNKYKQDIKAVMEQVEYFGSK